MATIFFRKHGSPARVPERVPDLLDQRTGLFFLLTQHTYLLTQHTYRRMDLPVVAAAERPSSAAYGCLLFPISAVASWAHATASDEV